MRVETPTPLSITGCNLTHRLSGVRVLVVDDQEDARDLMGVVLGGAGAQVTLAESVPAALTAMTEVDFQVLVSDIGMPEQDGYDLIRRLRTGDVLRTSRALPAVAVTAFSAPEDRRRALAAGFQEHLAKPVDFNALLGVVERLAATRSQAPT